MQTEIVVVRIKPNLKSRLAQIAERQEMTMAEVYRAAFEEYCSTRFMAIAPAGAPPTDYGQVVPAKAGQGESGR